ncbi:MAG: hypothetical protein UU88_C0003G0079 [Parcubacteria group bacterium GW2011_GWC1_42_11]|uniref:Sulfatase N-terminal domain-containing protein n=1 Tax=Candidatus Nomurabacteria bacterium GW2011_GWC2_42_20 TaxID=1618756 RepID=A0A0G1CFQ6_9BACT|nr:MAG: hypothetical protein UU88_C0003G0079 [Parcubacteria group bacterium GW2011_GWC1_42_11]KKS48413.1 MAG: hypothetical protein UV12_C0001G0108 [Candidatus Nomurabacteria bacterium GW2011_GWC2_42_20]KKT09989.1 MAG: hypothetical protein UV86_C0001G0091 [Candidatus Nomurabacteria bacterium GW2011_GWB1_43_20]TAN36035.1 MAG: DUF229 domain-containing protein [Patescibacteria group bacterium]HBH71321.1 hypothetical protein [Candidatus Yonathbacteria bacterium]
MKSRIFTIVLSVLIILAMYAGYVEFYKKNGLTAFINPAQSAQNNSNGVLCKDCNLIVVSLSNVSAKHMSLYGYERLTTPNLDELAKESIVFENAFTQSSWTLPVGVSFFTSLYPYSHGVMNRIENNVLSKNIITLPEILKLNGYKTAAFTGGLDYAKSFGHMRGFDEIEEEGGNGSWPTDSAGFNNTFRKASSWIDKNSDSNFFVFLHGYDTHCPFTPPLEYRGIFSLRSEGVTIDNSLCVRAYQKIETNEYEAYYFRDGQQRVALNQEDINYLEGLYDEEILSVDNQLADFLSGIDKKILDSTVIVVFSDHGEMFAKHGRFGRAGTIRGTLYDDVLHIPLIIKLPNVKGKKITGLVQMIDVMPTLLNVLDITNGDYVMTGKDLTDLINGKKESVNDFIFSGSEFKVDLIDFVYKDKSINEAIRDKRWKLIHEVVFDEKDEQKIKSETYELYDVTRDPMELNNLIGQEKEIEKNLKTNLVDWAKSAKEFANQQPNTKELPDDFINEARKMGYW